MLLTRFFQTASLLIIWTTFATATKAEDWPHWRGPNRDGISSENSGWESGAWPPKKHAWSKNVGVGGTSPLVVDGKLYTMGWGKNHDYVVCLDAANGKPIWDVKYQSSQFGRLSKGDQGLYSGPCSTPEYDRETGFLYTLGIDGDLHCWDTNSQGRKIWGLNLYDKYNTPQRPRVGRSGHRDYGYTSAPLLYNDSLIVEVGSKAGNLITFDKRTGRQLWASQSKDVPGHTGGPVLMNVEGVPCVAVHTFSHLLVARLDKGHEGETVAQYEWITDFANNIASPAVHENFVLITSGYNHQAICKLEISLRGAKKIWEQPVSSKICSPIIHEGNVYFAWRKLRCLDFGTGEQKWEGGSFGDAGSCILTSDQRLIIWGGKGTLALIETTQRSPAKYKELARLDRIFNSDVWPHVVLADQRMYCKDRLGNLKCFPLSSTRTSN